MKAQTLLGAVAAAALLPSVTLAQGLPSFSSISSQCVDPSGFSQCWSNATTTAQQCFSSVKKCSNSGACTDENNCTSSNADCSGNCVCDAYQSWINCALQSCWNKVYSCEYQSLAMHAAESCPGAGQGVKNTDTVDSYIPFVPAPAGAAASCSCDISYVYYRHATAGGNGDLCAWRVANGTSTVQEDRDKCRCCAASEAVSAFYNTCPDTAPESVPFWDTTLGESLSFLTSSTCRTALAGGFDCHAIGFAKPGISGGNFYNATDLPSNGTATISDVAGNAITSPVAGPTLVWKLGGADRFSNVSAVAASATVTSPASGTSAAGTASVTTTSTRSGAGFTMGTPAWALVGLGGILNLLLLL